MKETGYIRRWWPRPKRRGKDGQVEKERASKPRAINVTATEWRCLTTARDQLGLALSQIVQYAITDAAHRLGVYLGAPDPARRPPPGMWADLPDRDDESTSRQIGISIDPLTAELQDRAAAFLGIGRQRFLLGATFRWLARLKATGERPFQRLVLPEKYES
jgi:hypothetical protein